MIELSLRFSVKNFELVRIDFSEPGSYSRRIVRGKTDGAFSGDGTFQWTNAVKAFAILILEARLKGSEIAFIAGEKNSLASSLDFALSKPPQWLIDIFLKEESNPNQIRKYFRRTNPERKRPGPVLISLNPNRFSANSFKFYLDSEAISEASTLTNIKQHIEFQNSINIKVDEKPDLTCDYIEIAKNLLAENLEQEIFSSIGRIDLISDFGLKRAYTGLLGIPNINRFFKKPEAIFSKFAQSSKKEFLGTTFPTEFDNVLRSNPIKVITSCPQTGSAAVIEYLKTIKGYPIELELSNPYGVAVAHKAKNLGQEPYPIIVSTGIGPTRTLLNDPKKGYYPLIFGPLDSHRLLEHGSGNKTKRLDFIMPNEEPTSSHFYTELHKYGQQLKRQSISSSIMEPDDVTSLAITNQNFLSTQWFPHYVFHKEILGAKELPNTPQTCLSEISLLICNQELEKNSLLNLAFRTAFRDAWISLIENPQSLRITSKALFNREGYVPTILRSAGIFHLNRIKLQQTTF